MSEQTMDADKVKAILHEVLDEYFEDRESSAHERAQLAEHARAIGTPEHKFERRRFARVGSLLDKATAGEMVRLFIADQVISASDEADATKVVFFTVVGENDSLAEALASLAEVGEAKAKAHGVKLPLLRGWLRDYYAPSAAIKKAAGVTGEAALHKIGEGEG